MVTIKINGVEQHVKTDWSEVDPDKLMACDTIRDELECLTDIPRDILDKATDVQLFPIYTLCSFIDDLELIQEVQAVSIPDNTYERLELTKTNIKTGKTYTKLLKAGRIYYPDQKDCVLLLGYGANIINQIAVFLESYTEMIESEPEADEVWAGVESLSDFGAWGTAYVLADRNILNLNAVLKMPALEVYEVLRYNFREAKYMKNLYEIKNRPK
jgi:hypothetical protein